MGSLKRKSLLEKEKKTAIVLVKTAPSKKKDYMKYAAENNITLSKLVRLALDKEVGREHH